MKTECNATDPICKSGEQPKNVFWGMKWVENGRIELKIGGIEAKWPCGPFGEVVEAKPALRADTWPKNGRGGPFLPQLLLQTVRTELPL